MRMLCLNCENPYSQTDKYCRNCGQATATGRLTTPHAAEGFFHAFTHTDKGFLFLIPQLLSKPGIIAREYNLGKRKTYFNPFTFVLIIVALSTVLVSTFNLMSIPHQEVQHPAVTAVTNFTNKHFNIMVFLSIPMIALFTSLFFTRRINFAESLVLVSYASGERSIFFSLIIVPLVLLFPQLYYPIIYSYLLLFLVYYSWACCQYFGDFTVKTFSKAALSFIFSQLLITVGITLIIFLLVMASK